VGTPAAEPSRVVMLAHHLAALGSHPA